MYFSEGDGYDASRLLLGDLRSRLEPLLGPSFYVTIAARDSFEAYGVEPESLLEGRRSRTRTFFQNLPYPISEHPFLVTSDGIAGTVAVEENG